MPKDCTHREYMLSPTFEGPRFEKNHVQFNALLELPGKNLWPSLFYKILSCHEREGEIGYTFKCMENLYPAPTGWSVSHYVTDLFMNKVSTWCVEQGKAVIHYERPKRHLEDFKDILEDMCEGYTIVHAYKDLSRKEEYYDKAIPFGEMQRYYKTQCASKNFDRAVKPSFCYSEYKFESENRCYFYKLDCAEHILYKSESDSGCTKASRPMYTIHQDSYSLHRDLLVFASLSYQDQIYDQSSLPNSWSFLSSRENKEVGFYGCSFINHYSEKVVVAFRGTDDLSVDWYGSNICFWTGCEPAQYKDALDFFKSAKHQYSHYEFILTGHSLGGGLAQLVAIAEQIPAVAFDSPGIRYPGERMFPSEKLYYAEKLITSYIFGFNLVNSCCSHIVDPIKVTERVIEDCDKFFWVGNTVHQHKIEPGQDLFDLRTGRPLFLERVDKNDLNLDYAYNRFKQDCQKEIYDWYDAQFVCAKKLSIAHNLPRDILVIQEKNVKAIAYLPILSESYEGCNFERFGINSIPNILDQRKSKLMQKITYDLPTGMCLNNKPNTKWSEQKIEKTSFIQLHVLEWQCEVNEDYQYYRNSIIENKEITEHYESTNNKLCGVTERIQDYL